MLLKQCTKCKNQYPFTGQYFRKDTQNKYGLRSICKECSKKDDKQYRTEHPNAQREWIENNKEKYKLYCKNKRQTPKGKYDSYKSCAKQRNHEWNLTFEEFITFWQKPCYYCEGKIETIGLDRIDNSKGYNLDNIVPCCTKCNTIKGFIEMWKKIDEKRIKKIINNITQ